MSESAEKTSTPGDARSADNDPTKRDPTTNDSSQILLEALQNFVIPLIHAANGENKKDISQIHLGLEAGKLLIALQEFISSMIVQSRAGQPQIVEVDLKAVDSIEDNTVAELPAGATDRTILNPAESPKDLVLRPKEKYQSFMGKLQNAVREHVFRKMPIRVLHFTDTPRDPGTKLQIMLLDRNGVRGRVIEEIQTNYSEKTFEETMERYSRGRPLDNDRTSEARIIAELVAKYTGYAILSHTWLRGSDSEVTYGDWETGQFDTQQPGYQKLANFCKSAWIDHGLSFGWMDTVCINKDSSSELDESIRSMYKWYAGSDICIAYLAETVAAGNIHRDPWFTRGWTFQELLAPDRMTFYNKDWKKFVPYTPPGDKRNPDIIDQISKATTITEQELYNPISKIPISRKMQLAATRKVMRDEDIAYSLMGICNVSISIAYGEGTERAFFRLMTEILNASKEPIDIFNCAQTGGFSGRSIIPSAPSAYIHCSQAIMEMYHDPPIEPLLLTHVGPRIPILLMPALREDDRHLQNDSIGDYYATVYLPTSRSGDTKPYYLLDKGTAKSTLYTKAMFGILNFRGDPTSIVVPDICLAVGLSSLTQKWDSTSSGIQTIRTGEPIVFPLMNRKKTPMMSIDKCYSLQRSALAMHGMTLITVYL